MRQRMPLLKKRLKTFANVLFIHIFAAHIHKTNKQMKAKTLLALAALIVAMTFTSCHKDLLEIETVFCRASINGTSYRDAVKVKEVLGGVVTLPLGSSYRFFIGTDTVAYIQFKLKDANNEDDCRFLAGGIAFPKNEEFPALNKEYAISYDSNLEIDRGSFEHIFTRGNYLSRLRSEATTPQPYGVMLLYDKDDSGTQFRNEYISLSGSIVFERYDAKTQKYAGSFKLHKAANVDVKEYDITGNFNVSLLKYNE